MSIFLDSLLLAQASGSDPVAFMGSYVTALVLLLGMLGFWRYLEAREARELEARRASDQHLKEISQQIGRIAEGLHHVSTTSQTTLQELVTVLESKSFASGPQTATVTSTMSQEASLSLVDSNDPVSVKGGQGGYLKEGLALLEEPEMNYPKQLLAARACFEKELTGTYAGDAYTALSETLFWLGELASSKDDKECYHGEGVAFGKKSVSLQPDLASAHLWYAANMGSHGLAKGIMSSLSYLGDLEKHGNLAIGLDERFFYGAPLRFMGRFYHQAPPWPLGKQNLDKSIKTLERALSIGPEFLMNHLYLAEAYLAKRKKAEARGVLEKLLAVKDYALMPKYMAAIQEQGKALLKKI